MLPIWYVINTKILVINHQQRFWCAIIQYKGWIIIVTGALFVHSYVSRNIRTPPGLLERWVSHLDGVHDHT